VNRNIVTDGSGSETVKETLSKPNVHDKWVDDFSSPESDKIYDLIFDRIARSVGNPGSVFLDAGCGRCVHSFRLAERGYGVMAVDFSEPVLRNAESAVNASTYRGRITLQREDLLDMTFDDGTFDNVLCWGVLMHMPEPDRAIAELDRVLKPGGAMVLSEGNAYSLEAWLLRFAKKIIGKQSAKVRWTEAGFETWEQGEAGELLTRQANVKWLLRELTGRGYDVVRRSVGEFTELHTRASSPALKRLIHAWNRFWFRFIRVPHPAFGNILILRKPG
jgi:2-polyprenyl-3-methyl-5-hydroxy-6-metoxy-1,4-benzoquinol methylase